MAIEGAEIVSRHVLDDTPLRRSLQQNETLIHTSARRMESALRIDTIAAQRGLHAVSLLLHTVGGQTTFLALQAGYTIVAFTKLGATFLGMSASARTAAVSIDAVAAATLRAQIAGINLARTNAANAAIAAGGATAAGAATDAARAARARELTATAAGAAGGAAIAKPSLLARLGTGALTLAKAHPGVAIAATVASVAALAAGPVARWFSGWKEGVSKANDELAKTEAHLKDILGARESEHKFILARKAEQDKIDEASAKRRANLDADRLRNAQAFIIANREALALETQRADLEMRDIAAGRMERHEEATNRWRRNLVDFQEAQVRIGLRKPSELMEAGSLQRRLARFFEMAEARRAEIEGNGGMSFGITTRPASAFRFGFGAMGSVVGEQNEQKNTTKAVEHLERTLQAEFRALFGNNYAPLETS
jgi:hypothetical protein